jgi:hypothetical protein
MALILLAGAGYAYYQTQQEEAANTKYTLDEDVHLEGKSTIQFLPLELEAGILQASLTTVTFFDGNYQEAAPKLQRRVDRVLKKNPWLGGWIYPGGPAIGTGAGTGEGVTKNPTPTTPSTAAPKELLLWYDPSGASKTPNAFACFEPGDIPWTTRTPYSQYHDLCTDWKIKVVTTSQIVGKDTPLWSVRVVPDAAAPTERFALVVSMCRLLGDAHTFYQLYGMLLSQHGTDGDDDDYIIPALNPHRIPDFQDQAVARMGQEEYNYLARSNPHIWERNSQDAKHEVLLFTINQEWLTEQRQQIGSSRPAGNDNNNNNNEDETHGNDEDDVGVGVSDDAILFSWFFRTLKPTVGFQPFSLRDCVDSLGEMDAGNYQNPIPYTPVDYATPQLLQQSLSTGKRCGSIPPVALPKFAGSNPRVTFCFGVDWTRHDVQDTLDDFGGGHSTSIRQTLHLPLLDTDDLRCVPPRMSGIILFTAAPGKLGAMCVVPKQVATELIASGVMDETIGVVV